MVNTTITHSNLTGPDSLHYIQEVFDKVYPNPAVFLEKPWLRYQCTYDDCYLSA